MRIESFKLRGGHGYLNLDVRFNWRLTFLTGINGSGKTTVVRGLVAVLTPSFSALANTQFDSMSVDVEVDSLHRHIEVTKTADHFRITVDGIGDPLDVPIYKQAEYETPSRFMEREAEYYREVHTNVSSHPVVKFLNDLPTPMFLDLERRYQSPRSRRRYAAYDEFPAGVRAIFGGTLAEGLGEAIELAEDSYRQVLTRQQGYMNQLRRDLILTAFDYVGPDPFSPGIELPNKFGGRDKLQQQRHVVSDMLRALEISDPQIIDRFFDDADSTLNQLSDRDLETLIKDPSGQKLVGEWLRIQPQLAQIARIVKIVEKHNDRIRRAHADVDRFLDLINRFLKDGNKRLEFQATGRLRVFHGDALLKGIAGLSSGERQLVVILTHLAFNPIARKANVMIIDEPELSLHIRWQEMFVDALETANKDIQFILATHSPSIILDRLEACVDVSGPAA